MRHYIEAYYADGRQILGNMDGQNVIHCKNPKLSHAWKRCLVGIIGSKAHTFKLVSHSNEVIATVENK